jgi:putative MATE family efflux protein
LSSPSESLSSRNSNDFTHGSIPRKLVAFAVPMLAGNLLQALYSIVNAIWVGRFLGPDALAAVSVSTPIIFALIALITGLTMATTVLVSQCYGARQPEEVVRTVNNSLLLLAGLGVLASVAGVALRRPILVLINTPPEVLDMASDYLAVYLAGLVAMFLYNAAGAVLRGLGDSRTPLRFLAYSVALNVLLDPVFIFGLGPIPRMGVPGAALATFMAQVFAAVISLRYLYGGSGIVRYRPGAFRLDWRLTALTFRIGFPAGIQQVLVSLSGLVVSSFVNRFGAVVAAGFGAGGRFDQFCFLPALSMSLAVSAVVGQNLGAGEIKRVHDTVKWAMLLSGGITFVITVVALLWPQALMAPFTNDPAVVAEGATYLRHMAFAYVPLALMFAMSGVLRGAGDTVPTAVFTLVALWVIRVPLAAYLSSLPGLGVRGVWMAIAVSPYVGLALYFAYYRTGRWQSKVVARRPRGRETEGTPT